MGNSHVQNTSRKSEDLGFVIDCLFSQAINLEEFRKWIEYVIEITSIEDIPLYIFDLVDFNDSKFKISNKIGFVPSSDLSEEENALEGMAYLRGVDVYDPSNTRDEVILVLEKNPQILERFKVIFPFINLPDRFPS